MPATKENRIRLIGRPQILHSWSQSEKRILNLPVRGRRNGYRAGKADADDMGTRVEGVTLAGAGASDASNAGRRLAGI